MQLAGAILAGGRATRLGNIPKGLIRLPGGLTLVGQQISACREAGIAPLIIAGGNHLEYASTGLPLVADRVPDQGPLGGVAAALEHFQGQSAAVLFLPCDLAGVTPLDIKLLVAAYRAQGSGIIFFQTPAGDSHTLYSIVHMDFRSLIDHALTVGRLSVRALWHELGAIAVQLPSRSRLLNVNTPAELALLQNWP